MTTPGGPPRGATAAVFFREAIRNARRWQTYALRFGASALLFLVILAAWSDLSGTENDIALLADQGRAIFQLYAFTQLGVVAFVAPMLVGAAISEEKDERTLELLAITRLRPTQILWGKILSRLVVLLTLVVGGTPALALVLSFGGISTWEMGNVVLLTLAVVIVQGCIGGFVALFAESSVLPAVAGLLHAAVAWFAVPGLYALALESDAALADLSPPFAMMVDGPEGLLPILASLPAVWVLLRWSGPAFSLLVVEDCADEEGEVIRSPEFWRFEGMKWRLGAMGFGLLVLIPALVFLAYVHHHGTILPPWVTESRVRVALGSGTALVLGTGTGLYLLVLMQANAAALAWRKRRKAAKAEPPKATGAEPGPARWPLGGVYWAIRGFVWPNPVAWREIMTRTSLVARLLGLLVFSGTTLMVVLSLLVGALTVDDVCLLGAVLCAFQCWILTALGASASMIEERRTRTLELLVNTTIAPARVVAGKVAAVGSSALPPLALACLLVGGTLWNGSYDSLYAFLLGYGPYVPGPDTADAYCDSGEIGPRGWLFKAAVVAMWSLGLWLAYALCCLIVGLRLRPARLGWIVSLLLPVALFVVLLVADEIDVDVADELLEFLVPFDWGGWVSPWCRTPPIVFASNAVVWIAASAMFVWLSARLRVWVRDQAG